MLNGYPKIIWLWTNTGNNFYPEGMIIPVSNMPQYDLYLIAAHNAYAVLAGFDGSTTTIQNILNTDGDKYNLHFAQRPVSVSYTQGGIYFGPCTYRQANAGSINTNNAWLMPHRIYGIKM
ncbi:MAG: hypothetical protein HFG54_14450 [Lachnospiraceae bacterium]|nr:hypothetical protein [Lachnospiraceae bacterium]